LDAHAVGIGAAQAHFARRFALFGGLAVQDDGFGLEFGCAQQVAQARLRQRVVLVRGLAQQAHRGGQVARPQRGVGGLHVLGGAGVDGERGEEGTRPQGAPGEKRGGVAAGHAP
jgi:hypothetical protein